MMINLASEMISFNKGEDSFSPQGIISPPVPIGLVLALNFCLCTCQFELLGLILLSEIRGAIFLWGGLSEIWGAHSCHPRGWSGAGVGVGILRGNPLMCLKDIRQIPSWKTSFVNRCFARGTCGQVRSSPWWRSPGMSFNFVWGPRAGII